MKAAKTLSPDEVTLLISGEHTIMGVTIQPLHLGRTALRECDEYIIFFFFFFESWTVKKAER